MKLEKDITALLMKQDRIPIGCWEVKRTAGKSIPFTDFAEHQIRNLMKASHQTLHIKIKDVGVARKEFDGITFFRYPAWCVCCYPAQNKDGFNAYSIDIDTWYNERRTCGRKSLTEQRANELGQKL